MRGKTKLLAVLAVLALIGVQAVCGYWVETLRTAWTVPVTYPVALVVQEEPQVEAMALLAEETGADPETEEIPDAEEVPLSDGVPAIGEDPVTEEVPVIEEDPATEEVPAIEEDPQTEGLTGEPAS